MFLIVKVGEADVKGSSNQLSPTDSVQPAFLLTFLQHLQVVLDATYIPPTFTNARAPAPPPRTSSVHSTPTGKGSLGVPTVSAPPQTPNPTPRTSDQDKQYVFAEGTALKSLVWGEDSEGGEDSFRLVRSASEKCWVAIYRLSLSVGAPSPMGFTRNRFANWSLTLVFIRTDFNDPLLCLTASATLRDKPLSPSPSRRELFKLIDSAGSLPPLLSSETPAQGSDKVDEDEENDENTGRGYLEEVYLRDGLPSGGSLCFLASTSAGLICSQTHYKGPPKCCIYQQRD